MKQFNINKDATLPYLELEPVMNGRNTFRKLYEAIQGATVTFSMKNIDTGVWKIANAKAYVVDCTDCIDCGSRRNEHIQLHGWNQWHNSWLFTGNADTIAIGFGFHVPRFRFIKN